MTLSYLPSLHQSAMLPPLRTAHQLHSSLNQHFPLSQPRAFVPMTVSVPLDLTLSGPLRRGKWTRAEEDYAAATISYFCDGLLAIQYGTTLRGYLAQQLHCDPMRISKKLLPGSVFAGIKINPKIGRRAYYPCAQDSPAAARSKDNAARHLTSLRQTFIQSIEEEEQTLEAATNKESPTHSITKHSSPSRVAPLSRKRSYEDIVQAQHGYPASVELTEPSIFYHSQPTHYNSRYTATTPVMCKLPKLTVSDDAARRVSYSPVRVSNPAVLPPLRVSLVRASMC